MNNSNIADSAPAEMGEDHTDSGTNKPAVPAGAAPANRGGEEVQPAVPAKAASAREGGDKVQPPVSGPESMDLWADSEPDQTEAPQRARAAAAQPLPGGGIKLLKLPELQQIGAEPDDVVIAGFEVGEIGLVLGAPGLGKSTMAIGFAVSVASGASYLGFRPSLIGPVMLVSVEDKLNRTARRIIAAAKAMGADREKVERNLHVEKGEPPSLLFRRTVDALGVGFTPKATDLLAKIRDLGVRLLIVEPLVEVHDANENENGSMHAVMAQLRYLAREGRCAVLVTHHVSRSEERATAASSRGAGAINAAARFSIVLNELDKTTAKQFKAAGTDPDDFLQFEIGKFNHGRRGKPSILRRREFAVGPFRAPVLELFKPDGNPEAAA